MRKGSASKVTARLQAAPPGTVHICSVVLGELIYGALHGPAARLASNLSLISRLRKDFPSLPFDDAAAEKYAEVREYLAVRGTSIGLNDLLIASIALANQLTLVTHNTRDFSRVPGLTLEDWQ
jgi:tRNA(fMet)-specific endonuclease VapC